MTHSTSHFLKITIAFLFVVGTFTYASFAQSDRKPTLVKTFSLHGAGNLESRTSGGGITVEGQSGDEVEVRMFVKRNGSHIASSDEAFDKIKQGYEITIEKNGNTIIASAKRTDRSKMWNRTSIGFHIMVPHRMSCSLHTSGGGLKISDVEGEQELKTSGGGIKLTNIKGSANANTSGGGITVVDQDGDMELHTSGGGITVEDARGNINGRTSGGGIHLKNIHGEIDVRTSGGGISVTGDAGYVKAITSGGNINVDISNLKKGLYLETSGGGIRANIPEGDGLDLDLKANRVNVNLHNFSGKASKNSVVGTMNGGGMPVHMRTSGGNINIMF